MKFDLKGWSAIYKTAKGDGTIHCDNGQSVEVSIKVTGGGLTFGKSETTIDIDIDAGIGSLDLRLK